MSSVLTQFAAVAVPTLFFALCLCVLGKFSPRIPFRWANAYKLSLSVLFGFIGIWGHLINPEGVTQLIPPFVPFPLFMSYISGILEIAFVIGMWWPRYESLTGKVMMIYLLLVIPFNIYGWTIPGNSPSFESDPYYLWGRVPLQAVFIAFAYYGTRRGDRIPVA